MGGAGGDRRFDLLQRVDLDDDPIDSRRDRAPDRLGDAAGDRDMIVP